MKKSELSTQLYATVFWWSSILSLIFCTGWTVLTGEWWWIVSVIVANKIISPLGAGIAQHRYFAHRSFNTGPLRHKFLLWISVLSCSGSPIFFTVYHRHHHKYADTPKDIHSPHVSLADSLGLWITRPAEWFVVNKQMSTFPKDLIRQPDIAFVHRHYYKFWLAIVIMSLAVGWKMLFLFTLPYIGWFLISGALSVNVLSHWKIWGSYRTFETNDQSYNNQWIQHWSNQEGLHNNHHQYPSRYDQAVLPGEFDLAGWIVRKFFDIDLQNTKKLSKNRE